MLIYLYFGLGLLVYGVATWFLSNWAVTASTDRWILRIALWLLGLTVAAFLFIRWRKKRQGPAVAGVSPSKDEILFLSREANQRLASSAKMRGSGARLADLPLVLVLGESGAIKTTAIMKAGIDAELLSGQDRADGGGSPPPTRVANFWLAGHAVFVEAGGGLLADRPGLAGLAAELKAAGVGNLLGRTAQAPRAVIVCCDVEPFLRPDGAAQVAAQAKGMRQVLGDVAATWASRVPVYVLFTKLDRVKFFHDYVRTFAMDEAAQVFGMTLPLAASLQPGIYNQEQTQRLTNSFDMLFNALAEKRCEYLRRENDPVIPPNVYEFPREYRKMRQELVQFLLELGRPSMLQASPFLRGFYFTGARPVPLPDGRRGAQWVFLDEFFRQAVLSDRSAFSAAAANTRASLSRRILYGTAAAASLIWLGGATFSFFNNRGIVNTAKNAAARLMPLAGKAPTVEKIRILDEVRQPAEQVTSHHRYRAPMSYRWGLEPGLPMYENVRTVYCGRLRDTLLGDVQDALHRRLRSLPASPGPNDDYDTPYNNLKAYLMMTQHPEKADARFLSGILDDRWAQARAPSEEQSKLAHQNFWFYSAERNENMCPARPDDDAVRLARSYLLQFKLEDRAYRAMIDDVNRQGPPLRFIDPFNAMSDPQEIPFAFSKKGYPATQAALRKALDYLNREPWVLGQDPKLQSATDTAGITARLTQRYQTDFMGIWNLFVDKARVHPYASLKDAAAKLQKLSEPASPMIKLFCMVAKNTAVENQDIVSAFRPFQGFAAGDCEATPMGPGNQQYMQGLVNLQVGVDKVASAPNPESERIESDQAKTAALLTAQQHNMGPKPAQLLKDPIIHADAWVKGVPAAGLNAKGAAFCQEIRPVLSKYPFNNSAQVDARPEEMAQVFAPQTGRLWTFQEEALKDVLSQAIGGRYSAKPDAKVSVNNNFVSFFNRAAQISALFFKGGPQPSVKYSLTVAPSADLESVTLQLDKTSLSAKSAGGRQDFSWPDGGSPGRIQAKAKDLTATSDLPGGVWSAVRFFGLAEQATITGAQASLLYKLKSSTSLIKTATSQEIPIRMTLDTKGGPPTLHPRDLALNCIGVIATK